MDWRRILREFQRQGAKAEINLLQSLGMLESVRRAIVYVGDALTLRLIGHSFVSPDSNDTADDRTLRTNGPTVMAKYHGARKQLMAEPILGTGKNVERWIRTVSGHFALAAALFVKRV